MKTIKKNELYSHLSVFLKKRGIEFTEGSYAARVRQGCGLLTDVINCTQRGFSEAATQMDQGLDRMRDIIHRKTAPKPPPANPAKTKPKSRAKTAAPRRPATSKKATRTS